MSWIPSSISKIVLASANFSYLTEATTMKRERRWVNLIQLFLGDNIGGVEVEIASYQAMVISTISVHARPSKNKNLISIRHEQALAF